MAYRLGQRTVHDPEVGTLVLIGDGYAAAGELVTLVVNPTVQLWLAMTADEVERARVVVDDYRKAVSDAYASGPWRPPHRHPLVAEARAEAERRIAGLLGPRRTQQLKRLSWRVREADALLDPDVADALGLSEPQRQALLAAMDDNEAGKANLFTEIRPARLQSPAGLESIGQRYEDAGATRLLALLTPRQRREFDGLLHGAVGQ